MRSRRSFLSPVAILVTELLFASPVAAGGLTVDGLVTAGAEISLAGPKVELGGVRLTLQFEQPFSSGALRARVEVDRSIRLREAFLDIYLEDTDLRLGRQRIPWGTADISNPTDNLNPVDYTHPFAEENRLEVLALRAQHYWGDWTAEFVWIPFFVPSPQPEPGSRWYVPVPLPPGFSLGAPQEPAKELNNSEFALKLSRMGGKADFSLSYFDGWDDLPSLHPDLDSMTIVPVYHRLRVLGADFATASGKWGFRGEAAYFLTEDRERTDPAIKNPYLQVVLGADFTPSDAYYFNGAVAVEHVAKSAVSLKGGPLEEGTTSTLMLTAEYRPRFELTCGLDCIYNLTGRDFLLRPRLSYSPADGVTFSTGLLLFHGPAGTRFGNFAEKDYLYAGVEMAF
ncbi:MAG: hypothetical protein IMX00_00140 [Limnochordales bacterium]|nr:hypothetical protein [Limnochordales bacterium]